MTAYHDLDSPDTMRTDAARMSRPLTLGPGISYADFPHDLPKPEISISEAAARLATAFDRA